MKRIFLILTLSISIVICFASCSSKNGSNDNKQMEMPNEMKAAQSYLMDDEKFSRIKTADGEYLLAFYGRIDGEPDTDNRIIYLNKYNEVVKDFKIPFDVNNKNHDFYFGEKYVMMINRQYSGVDTEGNLHGIAIFDTTGDFIANYEPRDPYIFTGVDMYTRSNRTGYSWCESDNESIVFNTPFAIYEYDIKNSSLEKLLGLEDIIPDLDYNSLLEDTDYLDIFGCKYGFYYMFRNNEHGLVFSVNENLEKDLVQYTASEKYTMYSLKDGAITALTEKDKCEGILLYNTDGTCVIHTCSDDKSYSINDEKHPEYDYSARNYKLNNYALNNNFDPLVVGWDNSPSQLTLNYFDSTKNKHYEMKVDTENTTMNGLIYNRPYIACGEYVYFDSGDMHYDDICYRFNVSTGEGAFVYGGVEYMPLCLGYRIFEERSTSPGMMRIKIFIDHTI